MMAGTVFKYGSNVDTDVILPARYLALYKDEDLAAHCMEDLDSGFVTGVHPGDYIVVGENFGCGSSREHAPIAIKASGIRCLLRPDFLPQRHQHRPAYCGKPGSSQRDLCR